MEIYRCDRCGKEITKAKYKVNIHAIEVADGGALVCAESLGYNLMRGFREGICGSKYYCRDCVAKVERLLDNAEISEKMDN